MKKLFIIAILLIGFLANAQAFKIEKRSSEPTMKFVEIDNDSVEVTALLKNGKFVDAKRIVKQVKCTYDSQGNLEGKLFYKITHYLIEGKEVKTDDVLYDRKSMDISSVRTGSLQLYPEFIPFTITPN